MGTAVNHVISQFKTEGRLTDKKPYGNGHINDTFLVTCEMPEGGKKRCILQKMNHSIFKQPVEVKGEVVFE